MAELTPCRWRLEMADRRAQRLEELALLNTLMRAPGGRRWLYGMLAQCHIYATTFNPNAMIMAFSEGERHVGLRLLGEFMEAAPDQYQQMLKEASSENGNRGRDRDGSDNGRGDDGDSAG